MSEPLQLAAIVRCGVCGTIPCDSLEEADKRAEKHHKVTRHPVTTVTVPGSQEESG